MKGLTGKIGATLAWLLVALVVSGCGGGGGDRAQGVQPGPPPPGGGVPPAPLPPADPTAIDVADITSESKVDVQIEDVAMASPPTLTFRLEVDGRRVTGLTTSSLQFSLAELVPQASFAISSWVSFIDGPEDPICRGAPDVSDRNNACTTFTLEVDPDLIADSTRKVNDPFAAGKVVATQADTEHNGTLTDNGDGTWSYRYATDPGDPGTLANMLRACVQLSLAAPAPNACVDFVPEDLSGIGLDATSLRPGFYDSYASRQIVTEASCNSCHAEVAVHGGGRTAMDYCVNCHNPGTTDANSGHSMDFKVLVHRIHYARELASVQAGTPYKIWGYANRGIDFSTVSYPQNVRNCTRCHAGQQDVDYALAEGLPSPEALITPDGYNWAAKPSPAACLSCHENAVGHAAGEDACVDCHGPGASDSVQEKHRDLLEEQGRALNLKIESVDSTGAGESPVITFSAARGSAPINVLDPTDFDGTIRFRVGWDAATEYLNSGGTQPPIALAVTAANTKPIGGDRFQVDTVGLTPIPVGVDTLGISGVLNENAATGTAAALSPLAVAASTADAATPRRIVVTRATCNNCHRRLDQHVPGGRSVTDNPQICAACHEPNRRSNSTATSTDFSVLIHGLHASDFRATPYRSWDATRIQFPGNLADCGTCHVDGSHQLPLPLTRVPLKDASAAAYTTAIAAACGACHDGDLATAHMISAGGAVFNGPFEAASQAVEGCEVCHRSGAIADIDVVHAR